MFAEKKLREDMVVQFVASKQGLSCLPLYTRNPMNLVNVVCFYKNCCKSVFPLEVFVIIKPSVFQAEQFITKYVCL